MKASTAEDIAKTSCFVGNNDRAGLGVATQCQGHHWWDSQISVKMFSVTSVGVTTVPVSDSYDLHLFGRKDVGELDGYVALTPLRAQTNMKTVRFDCGSDLFELNEVSVQSVRH